MALSITALMRRGVVLREEPYGRLQEVDAATGERLRAFAPRVAVHRAGNVLGRIAAATDAGALVETDVRMQGGELVVSHEHRLGALSYDRSRLLLRYGDAVLPLAAVLEEAQRLDARLLLDLKLDGAWAPALTGVLKRFGLQDDTAFTGEWDVLDAMVASSGATGGVYYGGINRAWKLSRFLDQQERRRRPGVSLHRRLALLENIRRLHDAGASVLVYVVSRPDEALEMLQRGADGLITNNLALAEALGKAE